MLREPLNGGALAYMQARDRTPGRRDTCEICVMARTDAIVLGAGIVGTSTALQLAKRGLSVALVDRRDPGEETSYGNAGVIGGAGVYPMAFPGDVRGLVRIASKRSPLAHYHLGL